MNFEILLALWNLSNFGCATFADFGSSKFVIISTLNVWNFDNFTCLMGETLDFKLFTDLWSFNLLQHCTFGTLGLWILRNIFFFKLLNIVDFRDFVFISLIFKALHIWLTSPNSMATRILLRREKTRYRCSPRVERKKGASRRSMQNSRISRGRALARRIAVSVNLTTPFSQWLGTFISGDVGSCGMSGAGGIPAALPPP